MIVEIQNSFAPLIIAVKQVESDCSVFIYHNIQSSALIN